MFDLDKIWIDFNCPKCHYNDAIQLIDVKTERTIFCHNCKSTIRLIDNEASAHDGIQKINESFKKLENIFKNFAK
jgi:transcription elongation factor Elf1